MNKYIKNIVVLILAILIVSCVKKQLNMTYINEEHIVVDIYSLEPTSENKINLSSIADSINYIPLETDDNILVGSVNKIEIVDSLFYILDKKTDKIWCFNSLGEFIFELFRKGQGPEEYTKIQDFCIDQTNNNIVIWDRNIGKILYYDLSGKYEKNEYINIKPLEFCLLEGSKLFFTGGRDIFMGKDKNQYGYNCFVYDNNKQITFRYFPYIEFLDDLSKDKTIDSYESNAIVQYGVNDTIYKINKYGLITNKILFDFGKNRLPLKSVISNNLSEFLNSQSYSYITEALGSEHFLYATYNYKGRIRFIIKNNKTNKIINGSIIENDIDLIHYLNPTPIKLLNNKVYFVKEASEICTQEKDNKKIHRDIKSLSLLNEFDNPVIVIINLR